MTLNRIRYPWKRGKSPSKWEKFLSDPAEPSICSGVMDNKNAHDFCLQLLHAETEDEVVEVLKKQGYWADRY